MGLNKLVLCLGLLLVASYVDSTLYDAELGIQDNASIVKPKDIAFFRSDKTKEGQELEMRIAELESIVSTGTIEGNKIVPDEKAKFKKELGELSGNLQKQSPNWFVNYVDYVTLKTELKKKIGTLRSTLLSSIKGDYFTMKIQEPITKEGLRKEIASLTQKLSEGQPNCTDIDNHNDLGKQETRDHVVKELTTKIKDQLEKNGKLNTTGPLPSDGWAKGVSYTGCLLSFIETTAGINRRKNLIRQLDSIEYSIFTVTGLSANYRRQLYLNRKKLKKTLTKSLNEVNVHPSDNQCKPPEDKESQELKRWVNGLMYAFRLKPYFSENYFKGDDMYTLAPDVLIDEMEFHQNTDSLENFQDNDKWNLDTLSEWFGKDQTLKSLSIDNFKNSKDNQKKKLRDVRDHLIYVEKYFQKVVGDYQRDLQAFEAREVPRDENNIEDFAAKTWKTVKELKSSLGKMEELFKRIKQFAENQVHSFQCGDPHSGDPHHSGDEFAEVATSPDVKPEDDEIIPQGARFSQRD